MKRGRYRIARIMGNNVSPLQTTEEAVRGRGRQHRLGAAIYANVSGGSIGCTG